MMILYRAVELLGTTLANTDGIRASRIPRVVNYGRPLPMLLPLVCIMTTRVFSFVKFTWIIPEGGGVVIFCDVAFAPNRTSN